MEVTELSRISVRAKEPIQLTADEGVGKAESAADVQLLVGGERHAGHADRLSWHSRLFQNWLRDEKLPTVLNLSQIGISSQAVSRLNEFASHGSISIRCSEIPVLFRAAVALQMDTFLELFEGFLHCLVSSENAASNLFALDLAFGLPVSEIAQNEILELCASKFPSLRQDKDFTSLSLDAICGLLGSDAIGDQNEFDLFCAAADWMDANPHRSLSQSRLFGSIRFYLMNSDERMKSAAKLKHRNAAILGCVQRKLVQAEFWQNVSRLEQYGWIDHEIRHRRKKSEAGEVGQQIPFGSWEHAAGDTQAGESRPEDRLKAYRKSALRRLSRECSFLPMRKSSGLKIGYAENEQPVEEEGGQWQERGKQNQSNEDRRSWQNRSGNWCEYKSEGYDDAEIPEKGNARNDVKVIPQKWLFNSEWKESLFLMDKDESKDWCKCDSPASFSSSEEMSAYLIDKMTTEREKEFCRNGDWCECDSDPKGYVEKMKLEDSFGRPFIYTGPYPPPQSIFAEPLDRSFRSVA